ncbi:hypothetical protein QE152_g41316 [Popillia japonica]|uniref:Uncharacterized protein n=1 Tax=Popillia japonica TaxID=7064 RepID=A0AAW1GWN2_POPJA
MPLTRDQRDDFKALFKECINDLLKSEDFFDKMSAVTELGGSKFRNHQIQKKEMKKKKELEKQDKILKRKMKKEETEIKKKLLKEERENKKQEKAKIKQEEIKSSL